jgi:hypothetical protein
VRRNGCFEVSPTWRSGCLPFEGPPVHFGNVSRDEFHSVHLRRSSMHQGGPETDEPRLPHIGYDSSSCFHINLLLLLSIRGINCSPGARYEFVIQSNIVASLLPVLLAFGRGGSLCHLQSRSPVACIGI